MPDWRDRILKALTPGAARLTLAADPDGLLLEAALLEAIRKRGFEIVTFEDPAAFAWTPTITSVSRQAIFTGKPPLHFPANVLGTGRVASPWTRLRADRGLAVKEAAYTGGRGWEMPPRWRPGAPVAAGNGSRGLRVCAVMPADLIP